MTLKDKITAILTVSIFKQILFVSYKKRHRITSVPLVEHSGIEPLTSALRTQRSTS